MDELSKNYSTGDPKNQAQNKSKHLKNTILKHSVHKPVSSIKNIDHFYEKNETPSKEDTITY